MTCANGRFSESLEESIRSVGPDGSIRLTPQDAALIVELAEYAAARLRRDGQRLPLATQLLAARLRVAATTLQRLDKLISVAQAAALLEVTERRVRALIAHGQLDAELLGSRWYVERASVMERLSTMPLTLDTDPLLERTPR